MAATDKHIQVPMQMDDPARSAVAVTPSDTTEFSTVTRALFVGGAGAVTALMADGTTCTFTGVTAGSVLPIRIRRVNSTSTTATNMVALW
jgi:hypothetical protein